MAEQDSTTQVVGSTQSDVASGSTTETEEVFDKERAMTTISKLREQEKAGKQAQKELATAQARLKEIEDANKTEAEKRDEKLRLLEAKDAARSAKEQALLVRVKVTEFTADTDCLDKSWLKEKLQASSALELDDEGVPTDESLDKALKALRKQYAALFKPEGAQAPNVSTGSTVNADKTQQQSLDNTRVYSLTDPALWNGSQTGKH